MELNFYVNSGYDWSQIVQKLKLDDLYVIQERVVVPLSKLNSIKPITPNPLIFISNEPMSIQHSIVGIKANNNDQLTENDSGILITSGKSKAFFSKPFFCKGNKIEDYINNFENINRILKEVNISPNSLVRTWIFLKDLLKDYELLNQARDTWFAKWYKADRLPASTGIQGNFSDNTRFSLEFWALEGDDLSVKQLKSTLQNDPIEYGKLFSRGVSVNFPKNKIVLISGTASTGKKGEVLFLNDIKRQFIHTLESVKVLLEQENLAYKNIVSGIVWLKNKSFKDICMEIAREYNFPMEKCILQLDHDVCRDDWLCEIEATAIE